MTQVLYFEIITHLTSMLDKEIERRLLTMELSPWNIYDTDYINIRTEFYKQLGNPENFLPEIQKKKTKRKTKKKQ